EKKIFEKQLGNGYGSPQPSPAGNYLYYFKDKNWWIFNIATKQTINITENITAKFWDTRDDHPASKPPFGIGGWIKGDKAILLYDEYNIWAVTPDGKSVKKITDGE
ncbi:hypothetical protein ACJEM7_25045, partial [Escherichia coli]